jgi:FkbM family methyltransferase
MMTPPPQPHTYEALDAIAYYDEFDAVIDHMAVERTEQMMVREWVPRDSTVLELGARYGTVSCSIGVRLADPTRHVAVEPDANVVPALMRNRESHGAQFHVFNGVVSRRDMIISRYESYGTTTSPLDGAGSSLQRMTLEELELKYGLSFDVLVADCEGALGGFVEENRDALARFRVVTFEKDQPHLCDYAVVEDTLRNLGFECAVPGFHTVWLKNH